MRVGLDIGSTTIKCVVLDEHDALLYSTYERHYSHILEKAQELLRRIDAEQMHGQKALLSISGSAGMGLADSCGVPFVQEVFSTRVAVKRFVPQTDCVIELGGEDAKILFLTNGTEVRMNGSCAGGTGAFIDQMATLLKMSADEMDAAAQRAEKTYTIASRCGVFAKSDIQPILNQGGRKEDVAASIFQAVVDQTVAGLTQGRELKGKIVEFAGYALPVQYSGVLPVRSRGICLKNRSTSPCVPPTLAVCSMCLIWVRSSEQHVGEITYVGGPERIAWSSLREFWSAIFTPCSPLREDCL